MARRNRKRPTPEQRRAVVAGVLHRWVLPALQLLVLSGLGVGLGWGAYQVARFLRTSPALAVQSIEVHGANRARLEDLLRAADLREGSNIFSIDLGRAEQRLEEHPWVRRAHLRRVVPDRLLLDVEEYEPVVLVHVENLYLADSDGVPFKRLQPGESFDLPVVTGLDRDQLKNDPERSHARIRQALALLDRLAHLPCLAGRVPAELHLDELLGETVVFDPGAVSVRLGREIGDERLALMCWVLDEVATRRLAAHTVLLDQLARPRWAAIQLENKPKPVTEQLESGAR